MNNIEIIRALVRPYIGFASVTVILVMMAILVLKFGDAELAKQFATFILATGATVVGFYFGERAAKK